MFDNVLRALSTATRSLRLYPPTSPIPRQTVDAAVAALEEYFATGRDRLSLAVARDGFAFEGELVGTNIAVSLDFANTLRDHGIAQIDILPTACAEHLLDFLSVVSRSADDVRGEGGIGSVIRELGVDSVELTDIQLVAMDQSMLASVDENTRLLEIADSPAKLETWLASMSAGDARALNAGLGELVQAAGDDGAETLAETFSATIADQPTDSRDALLTAALEPGPAREVAARMFGKMTASDIASSILSGVLGRNMLSLSSALANLPFEHVAEPVRNEVLAMLPLSGRGSSEMTFLGHMLDRRATDAAEPALVDTDRTFATIVKAGSVSDEDVARAHEATTAAIALLEAVGVRILFTLLDAQTDDSRFLEIAESTAAMLPHLLERGDLRLAGNVLAGLQACDAAHSHSAEVQQRLAQIVDAAITPAAASHLLQAVVADPSLSADARAMLDAAGAEALRALTAEAVALKAPGLDAAQGLLGEKLVDLLVTLAPDTPWFQLAAVVERLGGSTDPRARATVEALLARPEEQARKEVVSAIASTGTPSLLPLLGTALHDPAEEVAALAARGLARGGSAGAASLLASRLAELDIDNADFSLAREIIGALARTPGAVADEALDRIAARRALIKRGRFAEIQQLVAQAQSVRTRPGGA